MELSANNERTIASGAYYDDRENTGEVFVFIEDEELFLTITVTGGRKDYGFVIEDEVCTRNT